MPEMTLVGWFHTALGALSIAAGLYSLARHRVIRASNRSGALFLLCTLVTALSALTIFQNGGFNIAHLLAVMTLLAVAVGYSAEYRRLGGRYAIYLQAMSYSATFLFHMIPAITDGLRRLPIGDPVVSEINDPLLLGFYQLFLLCYLLGVALQWRWLKRTASVQPAG